jgi:hypothetical protein
MAGTQTALRNRLVARTRLRQYSGSTTVDYLSVNRLKPYGTKNPNNVFLPPDLTNVLVEVADGRIEVVPPELPAPVALRWGKLRIEGEELELERDGAHLTLTVRNPSRKALKVTRGTGRHPPADAGHLVLADGREITARFVGWSGGGGSFDKRGGYFYERLRLDAWVLPPRGAAKAWLVPMPEQPHRLGNLHLVNAQGGWSAQHLRLEGRYAHYILRREAGSTPVLVVDTKGDPLDLDVLGVDLRTLEMALGRNIEVPFALGLDASGLVSGMAGFGFESEVSTRHEPPVPTRRDVDACWIAAFFQKVAAKLHADGENSPLYIACVAFLDALPARLDTAYLLLQIGLEGFCKAISPAAAGPATSLVSDLAAWKTFVTRHADDIKGMASNKEAGEQLLRKLRDNVTQPSASDVVKAAFRAYGVPLPKEAVAEIGKRNRVAHSFLMSAEANRDWRGDLIRIDMVRTMLVAMIAKYIGYNGPIVGWEKDDLGWATIPSWWGHASEAEAERTYIADQDP